MNFCYLKFGYWKLLYKTRNMINTNYFKLFCDFNTTIQYWPHHSRVLSRGRLRPLQLVLLVYYPRYVSVITQGEKPKYSLTIAHYFYHSWILSLILLDPTLSVFITPFFFKFLSLFSSNSFVRVSINLPSKIFHGTVTWIATDFSLVFLSIKTRDISFTSLVHHKLTH